MIGSWDNLMTHLKYQQVKSRKYDSDHTYFNQYEVIKIIKKMIMGY